jgi:hypothetical protein
VVAIVSGILWRVAAFSFITGGVPTSQSLEKKAELPFFQATRPTHANPISFHLHLPVELAFSNIFRLTVLNLQVNEMNFL